MADKPIALGHALFAFVEPHPGYARAFNLWYERDHVYAAGAAPWTLASQRWIATRPLKTLRYPIDNPICRPVERGTFLAGYWIRAGKLDEQQRWVQSQMGEFYGPGRAFEHRDNLGTTTYDYLGGAFRDPEGVPAEQALERRFPGMVWTWVERRPAVALDALAQWLLREELPASLEKSALAMSLVFAPRPKPDWYPKAAPEVPGVGERLLVVSFTEVDPRDCWGAAFAGEGARIDAAGRARTLLVAPFIPTVPGTDRYLDEI
jgi:hypothetical protein